MAHTINFEDFGNNLIYGVDNYIQNFCFYSEIEDTHTNKTHSLSYLL